MEQSSEVASSTPNPTRAWSWLGAASIAGATAGIWQLQAALQDAEFGPRLRENAVLWHAWIVVPWLYLGVQAWRLRDFAVGLQILGVLAMSTVLLGVAAWQLRIESLPLESRVQALALLPLLQAGVLTLAGLSLWIARRWRT